MLVVDSDVLVQVETDAKVFDFKHVVNSVFVLHLDFKKYFGLVAMVHLVEKGEVYFFDLRLDSGLGNHHCLFHFILFLIFNKKMNHKIEK